jgi:glycosyltransferase involved in cell wall biosynthesis
MRSRHGGVLRIYDQVRTAHLERLEASVPGRLLYFTESYDFDRESAARLGAERTTLLSAVFAMLRERPTVVELNEPAYFRIWPRLLVFLLVVRVQRILGVRTRVVSYAIENGPIDGWLAEALPLPSSVTRSLVRSVMKRIVRAHDALAFGSEDSRAMYQRVAGSAMATADVKTFDAVAPVCETCVLAKDPSLVVFLGAFEQRKGVLETLAAFAEIQDGHSRLILLGKGPLEDLVRRAAAGNAFVEVETDPGRDRIHELLAKAHTLVMPSQPMARWKEQIGLPIVEALSHGCEIVTTDETGLAGWLETNRHHVVSAGDPVALADALRGAGRQPLRVQSILGVLPDVDGRIQADHWMCS